MTQDRVRIEVFRSPTISVADVRSQALDGYNLSGNAAGRRSDRAARYRQAETGEGELRMLPDDE